MKNKHLLTSIRRWLGFFMAALVLSGLTAFPLESELQLLSRLTPYLPGFLANWINTVYYGLKSTNSAYPFLAYGTDWLAFAHLIIALVFIGPYLDPIRNIWVLEFGMMACVLIFPLAFIAGTVRGIPYIWQLIDCSFGVFGFIPLWICYQKTKLLHELNSPEPGYYLPAVAQANPLVPNLHP